MQVKLEPGESIDVEGMRIEVEQIEGAPNAHGTYENLD